MTEQEIKDLKYLQAAIRNGTTCIEGCMAEARKYLRAMEAAVTAYSEGLDDSLDQTGSEREAK